MPSCPNCGRKTLRTLDWACQWCGYPLLSKSFKKIDKTFKELQEERNISTRPAPAEKPAIDYTQEIKLEPEPAPEPAYRPEISETPAAQPEAPAALEPETELPPGPEPAPELAKGPEPEPEPSPPEAKKPARKRKKKAAPKARKKSKKDTEPAPKAEPEPEPMITPPPAAETEPMITPPPASEPPAPATPEPAPPVDVPKIETLAEGQLLTVDGLDALFRENKIATHTALTDKTMKIQGVVDKIFIRDHIEVRYIVLKGAQKKLLWPVRCTFGKEAVNEMYRLKEGQEVVIQGIYDGYGKNIIFKECVVFS